MNLGNSFVMQGVSRFKEKLGLDDVDGALKTVKENPSQVNYNMC